MWTLATSIAEAVLGFTSETAPDALAGQALTIATHLTFWLGYALLACILVGLFHMITRPFVR